MNYLIKKIAKEILPPFIHTMLRSILYRNKGRYRPAWHTINSGNLQGRQIFIDPKDGLWQKDMIEGRYDRFMFDYLRAMNLVGKTVFDIGAHVGYHAMHFASLVGDKGSVYAFEPNHFNRARLTINLDHNPDLAKRIRIFDVAISDKNGKEEFYSCRDVDSGTSAGSFISKAHTFYPKSEQYLRLFEKTAVKTASLDNISSCIGADIVPHVIKIDVEGAESSVLHGGGEMLRKYRPLIILEVHSTYNMLKTYEILQAARYKVVLLKEEADGRCFIAAEPHATPS
jgi:FkbM family methyltransferase